MGEKSRFYFNNVSRGWADKKPANHRKRKASFNVSLDHRTPYATAK
jgi:hypothetical protein